MTKEEKIKFLKHQIKAYQTLLHLKQSGKRGMLLFHSLGSGKTITMLYFIKNIKNKVKNIYIICPSYLIENIKINIKKINYQKIDKKITYIDINDIQSFLKIKPSSLILIDEAHLFITYFLKNNNIDIESKKKIIDIINKSFFTVVSTATPITTSVSDIFIYENIFNPQSNFHHPICEKNLYPEYFTYDNYFQMFFFNRFIPFFEMLLEFPYYVLIGATIMIYDVYISFINYHTFIELNKFQSFGIFTKFADLFKPSFYDFNMEFKKNIRYQHHTEDPFNNNYFVQDFKKIKDYQKYLTDTDLDETNNSDINDFIVKLYNNDSIQNEEYILNRVKNENKNNYKNIIDIIKKINNGKKKWSTIKSKILTYVILSTLNFLVHYNENYIQPSILKLNNKKLISNLVCLDIYKTPIDDSNFPFVKNVEYTYFLNLYQTFRIIKDFLNINSLREEDDNTIVQLNNLKNNCEINIEKIMTYTNMFKSSKFELLFSLIETYNSFIVISTRYFQSLKILENFIQTKFPQKKYTILYNQEPNKENILKMFAEKNIDILILEPLIVEGISIFNTKCLILMDVDINQVSRKQIIGRVVRYKSHENTKNKEVHIISLISKFDKNNLQKALDKILPFYENKKKFKKNEEKLKYIAFGKSPDQFYNEKFKTIENLYDSFI